MTIGLQPPRRRGLRACDTQQRMTPALARQRTAYRSRAHSGTAAGPSAVEHGASYPSAIVTVMASTEEQRVLDAIVDLDEELPDIIEVHHLIARSGLDEDAVQRALRALSAHGELYFRSVLEPSGLRVVYVNHVTLQARQTVKGAQSLAMSADTIGRQMLTRGSIWAALGRTLGAAVAAVAAKLVISLITDAVHRP